MLLALLCSGFCCCTSMASQGQSTRTFELVSPLYKGGFGATHIEAVAQDGGSVAYFSPGEFAGALAGLSNNANGLDYLSSRGSEGWTTVPVMPPDELAPFVNYHDISTSLSTTLALAKPGPSIEAASASGTEDEFLLHDTGAPDIAANWELAGGTVLKALTDQPLTLEYQGGSDDFCHLLLRNSAQGTAESFQLLGEAKGAQLPLYELNRGCNGEVAGLHLVAVEGKGRPISPVCDSEAGVYEYDKAADNAYNAISADGSEVFFTTCVDNEPGVHQLFVRLAGAKTLEVSRPIDPQLESCGANQIPCPQAEERPSAAFAGASESGSKVFFTTSARLVDEDTEGGNQLYMAEIGCPAGEAACPASGRRVTEIVQVSHDPGGGEAGVQGVVRVAPDGARVYFVATGELLNATEKAALEAEGRALPDVGADNLYVYDSESKRMAFVGDLCTGYELSGSEEDSACPSRDGVDTKLWYELGEHYAQTAGADGQVLVFASYARLTADDTNAVRNVYRYDAETGSLERVSLGEDGYDSNGNGALGASIAEGSRGESVQLQHELGTRAISEKGSRIIFTSAEALSPRATNGLSNVYEWHEAPDGVGGSVTLISGGGGETPVEDAVISPEGNDVFFVTTQGLVPQDTDGEADIYDARIGGGFSQQPTSSEPCSSDACQGPLTNPAPLLVPATVSQTPGENFAPPKPATAKTKSKAKKKKKRKAAKAKAKGRAKRASRARGHRAAKGGRRR